MKKGEFKWTSSATRAFEEIKRKITEGPVLQIPNFDKVFKIACDASNVGIGGVLSQKGHPIAFFSEKLSDVKKKYSSYDLELYAIVQSLCHWRHHLIGNEFVLYSDNDALRHLHSQQKISANRAKWSAYIQEFSFSIRHTAGKDNLIADALSRRKHLLTTMSVSVPGFDQLKLDYADDPDFGSIYAGLSNGDLGKHPHYIIHDNFLFKVT